MQGLTTLNLNFVSSEAFIKFVHYVYTGQLEVSASLALYDLISISSLFGLDSLTKWCSAQINNKLNPRNAHRLLNEAAAISDRIPNKNPILKTLLQWVGDNIQTLTERNLLEDLDIAALVLLGNFYIIAVPGSDFSLIIILSEVWLSDAHAVRDRSLEVLSQLGQEEMRHQPPETSPDLV